MKKTIFAVMILALLTACGPTGVVLTPAASIPDDPFLTTSCATVYSSVPWGVKLKGSVVLDDYKRTEHLFLMNLENGSETLLATPNDTIGDIYVSPDHKRVAYQRGNPKTAEWSIVVADAQGNRKIEHVWTKGFFILGRWVNKDEILIYTNPSFVIFNPDTKQEKSYVYKDFPGYSFDSRSNRIAAFDPSVERVVYKNNNEKVTLYDIPNKKVLAEISNHPNPTFVGYWAPDNSQVTVAGTIMLTANPSDKSDDLFSITRDGDVKRLTRLTDHYGKLVTISKAGLSWSPDSKLIAFWAIYPQNMYEYWDLVVYDLTTQKTTNYCISNVYESTLKAHSLPAPVWSADGKYLMVENRYSKDSNRVLILDLAKKAAYQIAEDMFPAGWLLSETP